MKIMFLCLSFFGILIKSQSACSQSTDSSICLSDCDVPVEILLPPVMKEAEFVTKMNRMVNDKFQKWLKRLGDSASISRTDLQRLKAISISVKPERNTLGSCDGKTIYIDEGNLLVAYDMCYAAASLDRDNSIGDQFNKWHDYLIDAIVQKDPITYINGYQDFNDFIFSNGGLDIELQNEFVGLLNSWIALIVFHEIGHLMLNHLDRWNKRFPHLSFTEKGSWNDAQLAFSRRLELEADSFSIALYVGKLHFDVGPVLSSYIDWQLARDIALKKSGFVIFPTHPSPEQRSCHLLNIYCATVKEEYAGLCDKISAYIDGYRQKIKDGPLIEVPPMTGVRPPELSINFERFLVRDNQLIADHQAHATKH
jgi:hypothetical protein